jgi:dolichyl-phosphate-mannose-protein mannosyltransferase
MSDNTSKSFLHSTPAYWWAMVAIFALSIGLRFWGLGRFNSFVFDEIYYAKFANNYLTNTPFFNAHPPLSQYIIAIGIWLGDMLPIGHDTVNSLTGSERTTFSYRWFNAIFGAFIPPVTGFIAYQLSRRPTHMVLAALLMAMDGLFLVDSRYALNNVFLVLFGILGQLLLLLALNCKNWSRALYMLGSGVFFGLSIACKWNGLWFLLGIWLLLGVIVVHQMLTGRQTTTIKVKERPSILVKLSTVKFWEIGLFLLLIPAATYALSWIPHLLQNPQPDFWAMQKEILFYHSKVGNGKDVHPYCANWYTWPLMMRPLAYYYEVVKSPISQDLDKIYDVHALGNPVLWWLAFGAVFVMTRRFLWSLRTGNFRILGVGIAVLLLFDFIRGLFLVQLITGIRNFYAYSPSISLTSVFVIGAVIKLVQILIVLVTVYYFLKSADKKNWDLNSQTIALPTFFLANYGANLFPWIPVTRCIYIYHYMGSLTFAIIGLAWFIDRWLHSSIAQLRGWGVTAIFLIAASFAWWMPIYLGIPLSQNELAMRMLFTPELWRRIGEMWNWI